MSKFEFSPPRSPATEKVKISLSLEILTWADQVASEAGSTRETVLEQAVAYALSTTSVRRSRRGRPRKEQRGPAE